MTKRFFIWLNGGSCDTFADSAMLHGSRIWIVITENIQSLERNMIVYLIN